VDFVNIHIEINGLKVDSSCMKCLSKYYTISFTIRLFGIFTIRLFGIFTIRLFGVFTIRLFGIFTIRLFGIFYKYFYFKFIVNIFKFSFTSNFDTVLTKLSKK